MDEAACTCTGRLAGHSDGLMSRLSVCNLFIRDVELQQLPMGVDGDLVAVLNECDCCHISGRPAFLKPSTKWSLTDASRSGWELSQWAIVK